MPTREIEAPTDIVPIPRQAPSTLPLDAQIRDMHVAAARLGLHDAADWLWKSAPEGTWPA